MKNLRKYKLKQNEWISLELSRTIVVQCGVSNETARTTGTGRSARARSSRERSSSMRSPTERGGLARGTGSGFTTWGLRAVCWSEGGRWCWSRWSKSRVRDRRSAWCKSLVALNGRFCTSTSPAAAATASPKAEAASSSEASTALGSVRERTMRSRGLRWRCVGKRGAIVDERRRGGGGSLASDCERRVPLAPERGFKSTDSAALLVADRSTRSSRDFPEASRMRTAFCSSSKRWWLLWDWDWEWKESDCGNGTRGSWRSASSAPSASSSPSSERSDRTHERERRDLRHEHLCTRMRVLRSESVANDICINCSSELTLMARPARVPFYSTRVLRTQIMMKSQDDLREEHYQIESKVGSKSSFNILIHQTIISNGTLIFDVRILIGKPCPTPVHWVQSEIEFRSILHKNILLSTNKSYFTISCRDTQEYCTIVGVKSWNYGRRRNISRKWERSERWHANNRKLEWLSTISINFQHSNLRLQKMRGTWKALGPAMSNYSIVIRRDQEVSTTRKPY